MGLLAKPQAIWTHDPGIFETNQDSQKVGVDNKLVSTWNILEIHTAKHSVGFSLSTCCITKQIWIFARILVTERNRSYPIRRDTWESAYRHGWVEPWCPGKSRAERAFAKWKNYQVERGGLTKWCKGVKGISSPRKYLDPLLPGASIPPNSHNLPLHSMKTQQGEFDRTGKKSQPHCNSKMDFQWLATSDPTFIPLDLWELFVSLYESWRLLFPWVLSTGALTHREWTSMSKPQRWWEKGADIKRGSKYCAKKVKPLCCH